MDRAVYRDEIKLNLTGGVLDLEIDDNTIDKIIDSAFREILRYIDYTVFETVPYTRCINLNPRKVNAVAHVYRAASAGSTVSTDGLYSSDPAAMSMWLMMYGGNLYNFQNYTYNLLSWSSLQLVRNTLSTDLAFTFDRNTNNLYINLSSGSTDYVTIEYVPRYDDISEIISDYWIDILMRASLAKTKIVLGRIRSKYTLSNALWTLDGATLLQEGNDELNNLRTELEQSTMLTYALD